HGMTRCGEKCVVSCTLRKGAEELEEVATDRSKKPSFDGKNHCVVVGCSSVWMTTRKCTWSNK
ncbi:hypothetical protein HAX54_023832, partial [Datura stramonium]|nr:hypothetical protein [Datura stramonium]